MSTIQCSDKSIYIVGDFNIQFEKANDKYVNRLMKMLTRNNFSITNQMHTREKSVIDNILLNNTCNVIDKDILTPDLSDLGNGTCQVETFQNGSFRFVSGSCQLIF